MTIPIDPIAVLSPTGQVPTASNPVSAPLHHRTPLYLSPTLSARTGHNIYLKLDCDQPSGSFKIRGIGKICQSAILKNGASNTHLISSSGGNAGLAVAYAASRAGVGCTICVPTSTEADVVEKLRDNGAKVVVGGDSWDQANGAALRLVEEMEGAVYVHPFEGDELVAGHSGLVDEVYEQFQQAQKEGEGEVDVLISSVGGGGLIRGIIQGVTKNTTSSTQAPVLVAVQNFGVDSFNRSFDQFLSSPSSSLPKDVVILQAIESKCTSMGTKKCSLTTLHDAIRFHSSSPDQEIVTLTVTDNLSASACWQFSKLPDVEERMVELSCASALTPVLHPWILESVLQSSKVLQGKMEREGGRKKLNVVVEVCGGSKVNKGLLEEYETGTGIMEKRDRIRVNGIDFPLSA
ncbi:related to CHA1 - L-serine/L-threonine deaminase [Ustilago trichophora]|uniref:L-serine ammonia-lyase n=1 Tax=Ustilago trichophora TaxID=86804 RepID=A0A5C3DX97_9BASI|nr:related to CHA1 - L-serine/L-threonine deaminase [Ustilago trichophora]